MRNSETVVIIPLKSLILLLIIICGQVESNNKINPTETPDSEREKIYLGWGVILLLILIGLSFLLIIMGLCIDKPVIFIFVAILLPLLALGILKIWPKNISSDLDLTNPLLSSDEQKYSLYDLYKDKKNYRVRTVQYIYIKTYRKVIIQR